jgi:hypothetical protein
MAKQDVLRHQFADAAAGQVAFTTELTALVAAYSRGENIDEAIRAAEEKQKALADGVEDSSIGTADEIEAEETPDGDTPARPTSKSVDAEDAVEAMFEDERAVELRRRLIALSTLEERTKAHADGPIVDMNDRHASCIDMNCAEDNPYTSETLVTLQMQWDELLRLIDRSRSSIETSMDALRKAGLTKAQIKDVKRTFKKFATVPEESGSEVESGAEAAEDTATARVEVVSAKEDGEEEGRSGSVGDTLGDADNTDPDDAVVATTPADSTMQQTDDGAAESGERESLDTGRSRASAMAEPGLTPQDFLNAATALGISLPSDQAAVSDAFAAAAAAEGVVRMDLPAFAKFVRVKLGASASKADVVRALAALAEREAVNDTRTLISADAMRPVFGEDDELADFVVTLYDEKTGASGAVATEGEDEDAASKTLDYREMASALFSI